jgi:hypothetical protein
MSSDVVGGRVFFGARRGHMVAASSMWLERRVEKCEARVSRVSREAVDEGLLSMAA